MSKRDKRLKLQGHEPKVGSFVYRTKQPHIAGKVLGSRLKGTHAEERQVHVLWCGGEESWTSEYQLRDFAKYVEDMEENVEYHRCQMWLLEAM
jgi:hypothetical protein